MGLLGLNLFSTRLFPSQSQSNPPAKTAGDYAWLSVPFSLQFQLQKWTQNPPVCVLPYLFRCYCLFIQYRTPMCVLVVIRSTLEDTHLEEIINVLLRDHNSDYAFFHGVTDIFKLGIWNILWSDTFILLFHNFLNPEPQEMFPKKSLFESLISVASLENLIRVCCCLTLPWAQNI